MTREALIRAVLSRMKAQDAPASFPGWEDTVKFVFQALLGVGHLLAGPEETAGRIAREMAALRADPDEPLIEPLSPAWCRLNLRRAMAEGLEPRVIAGLMLASESPLPMTRRDVYDCCGELARSGEGRITEEAPLERILDEGWLPSHSEAYREARHPAYRVISADWIPCMEAVARIAERQNGAGRLLITLDGPCATGKSTLARKLARVFGGEVLHTDDFVIPHAQKTPERLAIPGGNCDADRLAGEVARPYKAGEAVRCRRYDFMADRLLPEEEIPDTPVLILEGSYCNLPVIRQYADLRLFLEAPWEVREERLRRRESPASLQRFYDRWIPLEDAYFAAYRLPDEGQILIRSGAEGC